MADLILLPTLERLHPYDNTDVTPSRTAFGLSLSVALAEDKKKLSDLGAAQNLGVSLLQPWTWKSEDDIQETDGDLVVEIADVLFFSVDSPPPDPVSRQLSVSHEKRRSALEERLKVRFKAFLDLEDKGEVTWGWNNQALKVHRESRPWPGFLGQLTQFPYPLPQALRLSFFLELDQDLGSSVVCAPILRFRENKKIIEVLPQAPAPEGDRYKLKYLWPDPEPVPPAPAEPAAGDGTPPPPAAPIRVIIEAQTVACKTRTEGLPQSTFFDFGSLWIKPGSVEAHGTDWRAGLELRVAEQLHLPRTITKWMAENRGNADLLSRYPEVVWTTLQKLREVLGPGLRKDAPDGAFLKRANFFLGKPAQEKAIEELRVTGGSFFVDNPAAMKNWIGWLREAVSGLKSDEDKANSALLDAAMADKPTEEIRRVLSLDQAIAALDQLLASVSEPETLRALFKLQWAALVKARYEGAGAEEAKLARALAANLPEEVDLERLLLLDHLGQYWGSLKAAAFKDSPDVKKAGERLRDRYLEILKDAAIPVMSAGDLTEFGKRFRERVLPETLDDVEPRGTRGLTFQLDTLGQDDQGVNDLLRNMQGVALLMRRQGKTEYHCLNMASAHVGGETFEVLIPSRLAYVNDLRSPTVTYDNAPLTVASPLGAAEVAGAELDDGEIEKEIDKPLIKITHSARKIPGLVFGEKYEVLPFLVTNSGAIPEKLAEPGKPWKLKDKITELDDRQPKLQEYLRESHVGALRFLSTDASGLPPIPDRVAPQIRELPAEDVLPQGDPLLKKKDDLRTDSVLAGTPLLLLAPADFPKRSGVGVRNEFTFRIAPPTIDLQTWDRWVAREPEFVADQEKERRKFVWRSFYQLAHDKGLSTSKLEAAGVYLDDPAVEGIWAELVRIEDDGKPTLLKRTQEMRLDRKKTQSDFSNWKTDSCTLVTEQNYPFLVSSSFDKGTLTVKLKSEDPKKKDTLPIELSGTGRRFRLSFYAYMKSGSEARFSKKGGEEEYVRTAGSLKGTSPWHLLIEIPQALPRTKALSTALRKSLQPSYANGVLKVGLDMNPLSGLGGHVYRAELLHQVWGWRGRPPAVHPAYDPRLEKGDPKLEATVLRAFHMSEFGARGDDEHRRFPIPRSAQLAADPIFHYEEDLSREGPAGDLRALQHRFSARVFSRWEGILPDGQGVLEAQDEDTEDRWQPQFVPCRRRQDVPPPKVRLVLPMTEGRSEKKTEGPGLMVVVDGPWYEVGGLAEDLEAQVMTVLGPEADPNVEDPKPSYFEIGTDPIVSQKSIGELLGAGQALSAHKDDKNKITFKIDGAIGHHRDHSRTDPFFLASSFLLHRPEIKLKGSQAPVEVDLSWCFVKLRFRRVLKKVEGVKPDPQTKRVPDVISEWSAPFWVQLLPGVERVEEDWLGEGAHEVKLKGTALEVTGFQQQAPRNGFHLFAVMTRKVIDFAGRPDQEAYVGLWAWDPVSGTWSWENSLVPSAEGGFCVRFIEVQSKKAPKASELWKRIFDANQPDIDRARIVRISNRYAVNGEKP